MERASRFTLTLVLSLSKDESGNAVPVEPMSGRAWPSSCFDRLSKRAGGFVSRLQWAKTVEAANAV